MIDGNKAMKKSNETAAARMLIREDDRLRKKLKTTSESLTSGNPGKCKFNSCLMPGSEAKNVIIFTNSGFIQKPLSSDRGCALGALARQQK